MTRDDIIRMARESGIHIADGNSFADDMYISVLYRFAHIVEKNTASRCAAAIMGNSHMFATENACKSLATEVGDIGMYPEGYKTYERGVK